MIALPSLTASFAWQWMETCALQFDPRADAQSLQPKVTLSAVVMPFGIFASLAQPARHYIILDDESGLVPPDPEAERLGNVTASRFNHI